MVETTKTLKELYGTDVAFGNEFPELDSATAAALWRAFYWRRVCDNEMFAPYSHSFFDRNIQQYYDDLRVQLVRFDPMVTKYLERQIKHMGQDKEDTNSTLTHGLEQTTKHGKVQTLTHGLEQATQHGKVQTLTHGLEQTTKHGKVQTLTHGLEQATQHGEKITRGGTDEVLTKNNQTQNDTRTDTIAQRDAESDGTSAGTGSSDSRSLSASLPRVDTYSANGINAPSTINMSLDGSAPANGVSAGGFDWRNADSQAETVGANRSDGKSHSKTTTTVAGNDISKNVRSYSGNADSEKTDYGSYDEHTGRDVVSNSGDDVTKDTGSDVLSNTGDDVTTDSGKDVLTNSGDDVTKDSGNDVMTNSGDDITKGGRVTTYGGDDRERYTGREGSPAELLQKARDFIRGTSAFSRLCRLYDEEFVCIYDD